MDDLIYFLLGIAGTCAAGFFYMLGKWSEVSDAPTTQEIAERAAEKALTDQRNRCA